MTTNENSPRTLKGDIKTASRWLRDQAEAIAEFVSHNKRQLGAAAVAAYLITGWADTTVEARGIQTVTVESGQSLREDLADNVEGYKELTPGERQDLAHMVSEMAPDDGVLRTIPESAVDADKFLDLTDSSSWSKEAEPHDFEK